jgi:NhaA family Na+:H+ antiporter
MATAPAPTQPHSVRRAALFGAVVKPLQAFFQLEAASGVVLLACALAALAWVNFGGAEAYREIFAYELALGAGGRLARFSVLELVNDGLMTLFFFVVGMEIKRELVVGELRTPARALLPAVAALGGMLVPAGIYYAVNRGGPGEPGWGIPMATDIAFCVGCLTLLKRRVPRGLVVFVTALAIFDDIGGILVIAVFYGTGLHVSWLLAALAITAGLALMCRGYVRSGPAYALMGAALWYALHHSGIHATIAGVVLGLTIPARPLRRPREVLESLSEHTGALLRKAADDELDSAAIARIDEKLEELEPPLERFVSALHPWVAFVIMPAFALANSGVDLSRLGPSQLTGPIALGTGLGLLLGKQLGIFSFTIAASRLGLAPLPGNASAVKLLGVSIVAGIGFTVALFIAGLAFLGQPELLDEAKFGIIAGSLASGLTGCLLLVLTPIVKSDSAADATEPGAA